MRIYQLLEWASEKLHSPVPYFIGSELENYIPVLRVIMRNGFDIEEMLIFAASRK